MLQVLKQPAAPDLKKNEKVEVSNLSVNPENDLVALLKELNGPHLAPVVSIHPEVKVPFIPMLDVMKVLKEYISSPNKSFVIAQNNEQVELKATDYTFLNPANVYQNPELILLMCEASGKFPIDLVSFRPERVLLQVVAAFVSANIRYENEEQRNEIILAQYEKMKPLLNKVNVSFEEIRKNFIKQIIGKMDNPALKTIAEEAKRQVEKLKADKKFPSDGYQIDESTLQAEIATSILYKTEIYTKMKQFVAAEIANSSLTSKSLSSERIVLLLAGGNASGKGVCHTMLLKQAKSVNVDNQDIVLINSDSYKNILVCPTKKNCRVFSQIAHPEARVVIRQMAQDMADEKKAHLLVDQVKPTKKDFDYSTLGCFISCIYVSTKVEDALKRSFARGEQKLRFEDTQGILRSHKMVVDEVVDRIKEQIAKDNKIRQIRINFFDNNVPFGEPPIQFMEINLYENKVIIHNESMLEEFLKKKFINENAKTYSEIYSPQNPIELQKKIVNAKDDFLTNLKTLGLSVEAPLLKPTKTTFRNKE